MGCFYSKKDDSDLNPNVFSVTNIDESGSPISQATLEIRDTDLVLHRAGSRKTVWPLHSLRRYGFEADLFSFESGRRCETGEGIYAFKCRRAAPLFRSLQQHIQLRNIAHDVVPYPASGLTPLPHGRQTLQATVVHRSSIDNGDTEQLPMPFNNNQSNISHLRVSRSNTPISGSSNVDILEVLPFLRQNQANSTHVTNVYQVRDFKRDNNGSPSDVSDLGPDYTNDLIRDLRVLRRTLKRDTALNTRREMEDETRILESKLIEESKHNRNENNHMSPTLSTSSEHYAQLSLEQQDAPRLYVNITQNDINLQDVSKVEAIPTTPLTPKQVDYCNLIPGVKALELNSYANLSVNDKSDSVKTAVLNSSEPNHKFSESDTLTSMSPVEELEVNYAVLDIDPNNEGPKISIDIPSPDENLSCSSSKNESTTSFTSQSRGRLASQNSIEKLPMTTAASGAPLANIGYTTIDFDKTVALTSVAAGTDENGRKTRQNSCGILCSSPPSSSEKSRIF